MISISNFTSQEAVATAGVTLLIVVVVAWLRQLNDKDWL